MEHTNIFQWISVFTSFLIPLGITWGAYILKGLREEISSRDGNLRELLNERLGVLEQFIKINQTQYKELSDQINTTVIHIEQFKTFVAQTYQMREQANQEFHSLERGVKELQQCFLTNLKEVHAIINKLSQK